MILYIRGYDIFGFERFWFRYILPFILPNTFVLITDSNWSFTLVPFSRRYFLSIIYQFILNTVDADKSFKHFYQESVIHMQVWSQFKQGKKERHHIIRKAASKVLTNVESCLRRRSYSCLIEHCHSRKVKWPNIIIQSNWQRLYLLMC